MQVALSAGAIGYFECDLTTDVVYWSPLMYELHGCDPAQGLPTFAAVMGLFAPGDADRLRKAWERAAHTGQMSTHDAPIRMPDGRQRVLHGVINPISNGQGRVTRLVGTVLDVTQLHRQEVAQRQLLQRLEYHVNNSPLGVIEFDAQWRVTRWSAQAQRMFGWSEAQVLGRAWTTDWRFVHEDDLPQIMQVAAQLLDKDTLRVVAVNRNFTKDGRVLHCEWYNSVLRDEQGQLVSVMSQVLDVTDRVEAERAAAEARDQLEQRVQQRTHELAHTNRELRQEIEARHSAQEELRRSQLLLRSIIDETSAVVFLKDVQGRYQLVNRQYERIFGVTQTELIGHDDFAVFPAATAEALRKNDRQVLDAQHPISIEERVPHPDGSVHDYIAVKFPLHDPEGRPHAVCGIATDITELKEAQRSLHLIQTAIEQVDDAVVITTPDLETPGPKILYANSAFCRMTGYSAADLLGQTPRLFQGQRTDRRVLDEMRRTLSAGKSYAGQGINYHKDGSEYLVEWNIAPVRDGAGVIVNWVAVLHDITQRVHIQEQMRQHQAEFAHVARISAMGEMASGIAHELNQPLAAMSNFARGLLHRMDRGPVDPQTTHEVLGKVIGQADRASRIIRRMRDFLRKREPRRTLTDLNALIQEVVGLLDHEIKHHAIELTLVLDPDLPLIQADGIQIEQVIFNLLRNAVEALAAVHAPGPCITLTTNHRPDDQIEISVHDTGPQLSQADLLRIFEPFYSTKPHGMGVGLSLSRSIIEAHGGKLAASVHPDQGNVFTVTLPRST
jgi:PAS domain S-box-containing protein